MSGPSAIQVIIPPIDERARQQAQARQDRLTKPAGSLGRLEQLSIDLAGMTGRLDPPLKDRVVFTLAADHGVAAEGVSAYPREVTSQMVAPAEVLTEPAIADHYQAQVRILQLNGAGRAVIPVRAHAASRVEKERP